MTAAKIMSTTSNTPIESSSTLASLTIPSTASLEIHISLDEKSCSQNYQAIPTPIYDEMILQARKERLWSPLFAERHPISRDIPVITIEVFDSDGRRQLELIEKK